MDLLYHFSLQIEISMQKQQPHLISGQKKLDPPQQIQPSYPNI